MSSGYVDIPVEGGGGGGGIVSINGDFTPAQIIAGGTRITTATVSGTTTVALAAVTASRALVSDGSGFMVASAVTATELGFLSGVTSAIETQLNTKAPLASPVFTGSVKFGNYHIEPSEFDNGNSGATLTIDLSTGSGQKVTMTANCTFTLTNPQVGGSYVLKLVQDVTGSWTYTWPATVKFAGGFFPVGSGSNKIDLVNLYWDGTNYFGSYNVGY